MYMAAMFSMHAVAQLVLTIVVPVLLVQGAPVTLALRALRAAEPNAVPGPREWLVSALNSSLLRFIAHPWTALTLLVLPLLYRLAHGKDADEEDFTKSTDQPSEA